MINSIISFSINNKVIIALMTIALVAVGIWSMTMVPVDAVPDITNNQVQVITVAPDLGTEDIEQFVTYPVEVAMSNLPGVLEIRSVSRFGLSVVTIVFEESMGTWLPRQLVGEKLTEVKEDIPAGFGVPFMGPISSGLGEIYQYTLEVEPEYMGRYSDTELRTMQDWIIRRQMSMVQGVTEVSSWGGHIKQYEVAVNPDELRAIDITITDVFKALEQNNQNTGGAYIEKDHKANFIRGEGMAHSLEDIEEIPVKYENGVPILIRDIAEVRFGSGVRYGALTKNGQGEAVGGMILMLKGSNSNDVIQRVKVRMAEIQKSLPEGVVIKPFVERSRLIANTTSTVTTNLLEGGLIVIFVLVLLLGNWRGGVIVASTIPLSLLFAFIMMNLFDVWANLMSLGAIDFGIIVDGAVIIVESMVFTLSRQFAGKKPGQQKIDEIAYTQSSRMMNSAFFGQLIILIVFLPILALEGIEGKMFKPMALTFGFAILGAMILCLTYVPMVSALILRPPKNEKQGWGDKFVLLLERTFDPVLNWSLRRGSAVLAIGFLLFVLAGFIFSRMGGEFIPQLEEGDMAFHVILKPGSSLSETIEATTRVEKILRENFSEVEQIVSKIGVASVPTDPMPMDLADVIVQLKPKDEWENAKSFDELANQFKSKLDHLPGISYEFSQPIEMRFNELLSGVREDIAIKLYGEDLEILAQKATEIEAMVSNIPGVADVKAEATTGLPQMTVKYDRGKIAQYGLNIEELNKVVHAAFAGGKAGVIFEGEKRFDLVVRLDKAHRENIDNLKQLYINLPSGMQIPLNEVADISYDPGPMQISRDNTNRRTYVGINVRNRDIESLVQEIQQTLDERLDLPPGYFIRYGGTFENLERAKSRLKILVPLALGLIFVLIFFALGSLKQTLMIYIAIPLAVIGGVFSLWLRGMPFSISAGIGFIVLFGVAVLNGLVLISSLNELKGEGLTNLKARIMQGTKRRIRPILLTASTDILGFLPMAISTSAGAEVQRPLATVVIGGLLTSTLLTLIVLPVLYQWVEKRGQGSSATPKVAMVLLVALLSGLVVPAHAQQDQQTKILSLQEAVDLAKENYPALKVARLKVEREEALKKTSLDLGSTWITTGVEEKNINNEGVREIIGIQQQEIDLFSAPANAKYHKAQIKAAQSQATLTEIEVVRSVRLAYYEAVSASRQFNIIMQLDSLMGRFAKAAQVRYETEAISKLEYLAVQNQLQQIKAKLEEARQNHAMALMELQQYLGKGNFLVMTDTLVASPIMADTALNSDHPILQQQEQQVNLMNAQTKVARNGLLPKVNLRYGIQEIAGQNGFYSYQAGVSIPLWFRPQMGKIQAAKIGTVIAQEDFELTKLRFQAAYNRRLKTYLKVRALLLYYKDNALPLAQEQMKAASLAYKEGAIDYVTFLQNMESAIETEQDYQEYYRQYREAETELLYFTGQLDH